MDEDEGYEGMAFASMWSEWCLTWDICWGAAYDMRSDACARMQPIVMESAYADVCRLGSSEEIFVEDLKELFRRLI